MIAAMSAIIASCNNATIYHRLFVSRDDSVVSLVAARAEDQMTTSTLINGLLSMVTIDHEETRLREVRKWADRLADHSYALGLRDGQTHEPAVSARERSCGS